MGKNLVALAEFDSHDCKGSIESACSACTRAFFARSRAKFNGLLSRMDLVRQNSKRVDSQIVRAIMSPTQEEKRNAKY